MPPRLVSGWDFAKEVSVWNFVSQVSAWSFVRREKRFSYGSATGRIALFLRSYAERTFSPFVVLNPNAHTTDYWKRRNCSPSFFSTSLCRLISQKGVLQLWEAHSDAQPSWEGIDVMLHALWFHKLALFLIVVFFPIDLWVLLVHPEPGGRSLHVTCRLDEGCCSRFPSIRI